LEERLPVFLHNCFSPLFFCTGGNVDKADHDPRWAELLNYKPVGPHAPPLHNAICAIREAFEESGVLVTDPPTELSNDEIKIWRERVH
jgi:nucleoside diphosphate-linked moiety X motif protein 19